MTNTLFPNHPLNMAKSCSLIRGLWALAYSGSESSIVSTEAVRSSCGWTNSTLAEASTGMTNLGEPTDMEGPARAEGAIGLDGVRTLWGVFRESARGG